MGDRNGNNQPRISIFGGSKPKPGEAAYQDALQLGQRLGQAGFTVLTGGYIGTMEAVSRGAAEAGGRVLGVTCDEIEAWRPVKCNPWVGQELRFPTLLERIYGLIQNCDAALALPGGPGTLTEVAVMWNHLIIGAIPPRPLILIGPGWQAILEQFYQSLGEYSSIHQRNWLSFVPDVDQAVAALMQTLKS